MQTAQLSKLSNMYRKPPYGGKNLLFRLRLAIGAMGTPCDLLQEELVGAKTPSPSTLGVLSTSPYALMAPLVHRRMDFSCCQGSQGFSSR